MQIQSFDDILKLAIAHNEGKSIEEGNEGFFDALKENKGAEAVAQFKDNVALDYCGFELDKQDNYGFSDECLASVYAAAKIVYARYPGKTLRYDLASDADIFGSPWAIDRATPEQWVIVFGKRQLEDGEATIDDSSDEKVAQVLQFIEQLGRIGIEKSVAVADLDALCCDNEELVQKVKLALN